MNLLIETAAAKADARLSKIAGWSQTPIGQLVSTLTQTGTVEVGWRESCGTTDFTAKIYREWVKLLKVAKRSGVELTSERQKHKNSYATISGGFWQSEIYKIKNK